MSCPAKLYLEARGLNAGNFSHFKDIDVSDDVTPRDVYDGTWAVLMVALDEAQMATKCDPGLSTIHEDQRLQSCCADHFPV